MSASLVQIARDYEKACENLPGLVRKSLVKAEAFWQALKMSKAKFYRMLKTPSSFTPQQVVLIGELASLDPINTKKGGQ